MFHFQSQWSPETHLLPVRSPFALRNRMTERTSHLAGLWIGAAISNTSHSNKPVLPLSNEHGSQVKDQGRRQCCHNKHKKIPVGLHVMQRYFPDTPRTRESVSVKVVHGIHLFCIFLSQFLSCDLLEWLRGRHVCLVFLTVLKRIDSRIRFETASFCQHIYNNYWKFQYCPLFEW